MPSTTPLVVPRRHGGYSVVVSAVGLLQLVAWVTVVFVALFVIHGAGTVFQLLALSVTVAVLAAPAVRSLSRRMPNALALLVVVVGGLVGSIALIAGLAMTFNHQTNALADALHASIAKLPTGSNAAQIAKNIDADKRIDSVLHDAATRLLVGQTDPLSVVGEVAQAVVVMVIAAFLIAGGRSLIATAIRAVRRASMREQLHASLNRSLSSAARFVRRTLCVSAAHGVIAALVARSLNLPGAVSLGAWVAVVATIPIIGPLLGWAPIVAVAGLQHDTIYLVVAVAALAIVVDVMVRMRWVSRALNVGPFLTLIGLGLGISVVGVSGALIGLFFVAVVAALLRDVRPLSTLVGELIDDDADEIIDQVGPSLVAVEAEVEAGTRVLRLQLSTRTAVASFLIVVVAAAVLEIVSGAQPLLVWFAVGGFIAVGLDRPISAMQRRWKVPRFAGAAMLFGIAAAVVTTVIIVAGPSITHSARTITADAPKTVQSMESLPLVGRLLHNQHTADHVESFLSSIPDRLKDSDAVERISQAAGDGVAGVFWIITMLLAILWDGPRLISAAARRIPARHRRRSVRLGRAAYTAFSNVVAAAAFVAALNGTVVMLLAVSLGIPLAPVLGLWAATWNFIPQIGGFVGAVPLVALGFSQGPWQGVIALLIFVTYQTFENHVLQPLIGSRAVHVPPLVVLVGALFGGVLGGFVGALLAGPVLGVAKVAITEFRPNDRARIDDRPAPA